MRPIWETALTRALAVRLGLGGVPSRWAYSAAALAVRGLDRANNLGAKLASVPMTSWSDFDQVSSGEEDPDVLPLDHPARRVLAGLWDRLGWVGNPRGEARRLLVMARYSLREGGWYEARAAKVLADETEEIAARDGYPAIGPRFGTEGWDEPEPEAGELEGLREEQIAAAPDREADIRGFYAQLDSRPDAVAAFVELFQLAAKDQGLYALRVDGEWGRGSEAAWRTMSGGSGEHRTTLAEVNAVYAACGGRLNAGELMGAAFGRDAWLAWEGVPEAPFPPAAPVQDADDSSVRDLRNLIAVSSPKPPDQVPMDSSAYSESAVGIRPAPDSVVVVPVSGGGSRNWPLWTLLGLVLVGGVVAVRSRRAT